MLGAGAILASAVLVWMITAAPGYIGYGASLLWAGPKKNVAPLYDIHVSPGDAAVRRNSDELITAQVVGLETSKVTLHARFGSATAWDPVDMVRQPGEQGFQFLFAALPENVEYYVQAGPVRSKNFKVRVVDLPAVKALQVVYHYPKWTGLRTVSEEHGGDLRALEGTNAELTVVMDAPLKDGMLVVDNGQPLKLTGGVANTYRATIHMEKDGAYHVAATDSGQQVRLSEDYFISTAKANPPQIAISRPGGDYRASPIEEVTVAVKADADFGLRDVKLHYSVNGGPQQTMDMLKQGGAKNADQSATLSLEDFKLVPGDVVSLYATAADAHAESKTEISFIQVDPFEREFSQSQQSGGGGGGGGRQGNQTDISRREKELIAATWKQQNDKASTAQHSADMGKTLSEAQATLRQQALALSGRMQSRDLSEANEEFNSFEKDMQVAAAAMVPSSDKLKIHAWADAIPNEQKALQALLRAEATFRKIQVAFGQQGGGGGGGGGSAGRDLASLFDLEMDTEKNQYETAQTGSPAEEQAKKVDDALEKLDALAKRQEELVQQQGNQAQSFQQRWQQEMLRRQAEELQREMEATQARNGGQKGQPGQEGQGGQSQQAQAEAGGQGSSQGNAQARSSGQAQDGGPDPRVAQALERLKQANEEMRRAAAEGQSQPGEPSSAKGSAAQRAAQQARAAAQRLREATTLLGGAQNRQSATKLDAMAQESERLTTEESAQSERIRALASQGADASSARRAANQQELRKLIDDRQKMSDDIARLQKGVRDTARALAGTQPAASSKLRETLSLMDESDLDNRVQRTADGLRTGVNPNSNGTEAAVAAGLKQLNQGLRQAQQGMSASGAQPGKRPQGLGTQVAALDQVDRLRAAIRSLPPGSGQQGQASQPGRPAPAGQGSGSAQQGSSGQSGRSGGSQSERGQAGAQLGSGQGTAGNGQRSGSAGDIGGDRVVRGGGGGAANWNVNTGNNVFDRNARSQMPSSGPNPSDSERTINQGIEELSKLRQLTQGDPAAARQVNDLVKEMQKLDPGRFPGNPAMVEALHARVLNDLDKLELQLRRSAEDSSSSQVRTAKPQVPPVAYRDAVADYYRRLAKGQ